MKDILEELALRFRSGNSVPVERAHLKRDEWGELLVRISLENTKDVAATVAATMRVIRAEQEVVDAWRDLNALLEQDEESQA